MGQSTNAQLCYGMAFDEDTEFPWHAERFDGEIEQWWRELLGYKSSFEIYGDDGDYLGGVRPPDEQIKAYYAERDRFDKEHPSLPVEVVTHCSGEYPMYILAVPGTLQTARRGYPRIVTPANFLLCHRLLMLWLRSATLTVSKSRRLSGGYRLCGCRRLV